jgi:hypothetical protein
MPNYVTCPELAALYSCVLAQGGPLNPQNIAGVGTPEGATTGYYTGLDTYFDTDAEILYRFNGDIGANTGWVAIGP